VISFVDLKLPYDDRLFLESGHVHNRPPTTWAPNIPCPSIHLVSSNFVVPITHSFHYVAPPTYLPLHPPCKPQTTH